MNVNNIRNKFIIKFKKNDFIKDKSGIKTIEIIAANFIANENYIFGNPNIDYIKREINWYKSQSLNVNDIEGNTPKIWKLISDKNGNINSNYGWCIFSKENFNQYKNCLLELKENKLSRRAVMIYNRPSMWHDYNKNGMSDFICTHAVHFFIRNNKLSCQVLMRSNDAWAGYRNDYAWHDYIFNMLALDLKVKTNKIYWVAGSLHLYERQFYLIEQYINK